MSVKCESCSDEIIGKFCSNCGYPVQLERISGKYIASQLAGILFLEKGFFYTVRELLVRPGKSVRSFLLKDRRKLVKPVIFILLTSLIYSLANHYFPFEDKYIYTDNAGANPETYAFKISRWITENYGYSNLFMGIFIAFWIKLFFRKYKYNFFEILMLICFVMGMAMLFLAVFGSFGNMFGSGLLKIGAIVSMLYISWAIALFFKNTFGDFLKAFSAYILGAITFIVSVWAVGTLIDFLRR